VDWSQYIYLILLLIGSGVAYAHDSRFIILVMWANFIATMELSGGPLAVAFVDLSCAYAILMVVNNKNKPAMTIVAIFCVMAPIYQLAEIIGVTATYTIVDILAYVQIFAMGSTGFGNGIRAIRDRYRRLSSPSVSLQKRLDAKGDTPVALDKDSRP